MDKIKIKRVPRDHKKATAKEKFVAGFGVGATLLGGGMGGAIKNSQPSPIVRSLDNSKSKGGRGFGNILKKFLNNTFGVNTAEAAGLNLPAGMVFTNGNGSYVTAADTSDGTTAFVQTGVSSPHAFILSSNGLAATNAPVVSNNAIASGDPSVSIGNNQVLDTVTGTVYNQTSGGSVALPASTSPAAGNTGFGAYYPTASAAVNNSNPYTGISPIGTLSDGTPYYAVPAGGYAYSTASGQPVYLNGTFASLVTDDNSTTTTGTPDPVQPIPSPISGLLISTTSTTAWLLANNQEVTVYSGSDGNWYISPSGGTFYSAASLTFTDPNPTGVTIDSTPITAWVTSQNNLQVTVYKGSNGFYYTSTDPNGTFYSSSMLVFSDPNGVKISTTSTTAWLLANNQEVTVYSGSDGNWYISPSGGTFYSAASLTFTDPNPTGVTIDSTPITAWVTSQNNLQVTVYKGSNGFYYTSTDPNGTFYSSSMLVFSDPNGVKISTTSTTAWLLANNQEVTVYSGSDGNWYISPSGGTFYSAASLTFTDPNPTGVTIDSTPITAWVTSQNNLQVTVYKGSNGFYYTSTDPNGTFYSSSMLVFSDPNGVKISTTSTTAWLLANNQEVTVYSGSDGNWYISPSGGTFYSAASLTFTDPNPTGVTIDSTPITAWVTSQNNLQVTVYKGSNGFYYTSTDPNGTFYSSSMLVFSDPNGVKISTTSTTAWLLANNQEVTVYSGSDGNWYISPSGGTFYSAASLTFTDPNPTGVTIDSTPITAWVTSQNNLQVTVYKGSNGFYYTSTDPNGTFYSSSMLVFSDPNGVKISTTSTTAWLLANNQEVTVYSGSDGNWYISPSGGTFYSAASLTFTDPNPTGVTIDSTPITAWVTSQNNLQVTVYKGSNGFYYTSTDPNGTFYSSSMLVFSDPNGVKISTTSTTAWLLANNQEVTVYSGSDGNWYISPSGGTFYSAASLTFTDPNPNGQYSQYLTDAQDQATIASEAEGDALDASGDAEAIFNGDFEYGLQNPVGELEIDKSEAMQAWFTANGTVTKLQADLAAVKGTQYESEVQGILYNVQNVTLPLIGGNDGNGGVIGDIQSFIDNWDAG